MCMSPLRRGRANLLCIAPILVDVLPKRAREQTVVTFSESPRWGNWGRWGKGQACDLAHPVTTGTHHASPQRTL